MGKGSGGRGGGWECAARREHGRPARRVTHHHRLAAAASVGAPRNAADREPPQRSGALAPRRQRLGATQRPPPTRAPVATHSRNSPPQPGGTRAHGSATPASGLLLSLWEAPRLSPTARRHYGGLAFVRRRPAGASRVQDPPRRPPWPAGTESRCTRQRVVWGRGGGRRPAAAGQSASPPATAASPLSPRRACGADSRRALAPATGRPPARRGAPRHPVAHRRAAVV